VTGKAYTATFKESVNSTSGQAPVYLLEITHAQLLVPVRLVNDTQDLVSSGNTFTAYPFRITLPTDLAGELPRAVLTFDNIGRELTQWIDASFGGKGAQVRVMQVMRDTPDVLEYDITLDLVNVSQNMVEIGASLGFDDTLNLSGLPITYRPDVAPGLF
jgi:hypothetical protein